MKDKRLIIFFVVLAVLGAMTGYYLSRDKAGIPLIPPADGSPQDPGHNDISGVKPVPPEGAFAIRGIVEGFYGEPWTFSQRREMFSFMEHKHFNTYVYAPKDDPYQRSRWWELYPAAELSQLKELISLGKAKGIALVYSLSPGIPQPLPGQQLTQIMINNSIIYSSAADFEKLTAKIQQLHSAGVNTFMLSFDDVERYVRNEDKKQYSSNYAKAHIDLANKLLAEGKKISGDFQLWFAPTSYYGIKDNAYWQEIRANLNTQVQVIWTGSWVLAKNITGEQVLKVNELLGRKPLIWDNYPVNDYTYETEKAPRLMMGPLENRSSDLSRDVAGIIANPMIQPESSKIPLSTVGDYLWDPKNYDPAKAWLKATGGVSGGSNDALQKFCAYSSASVLTDNKNKSGFSFLAESFWQSYQKSTAGGDALEAELNALSDLPKQIHANVSNKTLLVEIDPWLNKLGQEGQTALLGLDCLKSSKSDPQTAVKLTELEKRIQELRKDKLNIGKEIIEFAEKCLTISKY